MPPMSVVFSQVLWTMSLMMMMMMTMKRLMRQTETRRIMKLLTHRSRQSAVLRRLTFMAQLRPPRLEWSSYLTLAGIPRLTTPRLRRRTDQPWLQEPHQHLRPLFRPSPACRRTVPVTLCTPTVDARRPHPQCRPNPQCVLDPQALPVHQGNRDHPTS